MSLTDILARVREAERRAGRAEGSVTLIAVSKVQPLERVEAVLAEGHRVFGENYVQEAAGKWPALRERFGKVELHMIGPLQTNKAKVAVELFDAIHTRRPAVAGREAGAAGRGAGGLPGSVRAGQYRRGAAEGRRSAGRDGRIRRAAAARLACRFGA